MDPLGTYLTVLIIGIVLALVVGQILVRSGRPFLADAFRRPETAASVTRLLVVLFHLIVLGLIALIASIDITLNHPAQTIVVRLGLVLLVLGGAYGGTLLLLVRLRSRRRLQLLIDERTAQAEQARAHQYGPLPGPGGSGPGGSGPGGSGPGGSGPGGSGPSGPTVQPRSAAAQVQPMSDPNGNIDRRTPTPER